MRGKFKSWILCATAAFLSGCSGSASNEKPAKLLYEGPVKKVEYGLADGKTMVLNDKGEQHAIEGFPMMFKGKIKLSKGAEEGYEIEILSLADSAAEAAPAAEKPAAPAGEYE